jgi:hypothetical protein
MASQGGCLNEHLGREQRSVSLLSRHTIWIVPIGQRLLRDNRRSLDSEMYGVFSF